MQTLGASPLTAPPAASFPAHPASWYYFCRSDELGSRPLSKRFLGRRLAAFRGADGRVSVLDAACSHLGSDLGMGCVVGGKLRCPYHGWEYKPDGRCARIPGQDRIPAFARQAAYPVRERHGSVFFFNGLEPAFPLPFFGDRNPEEFSAGRPFSFTADCSWYMSAAHAFDERHFLTVHDRRLTEPPTVDCPAEFARRNRYRAEVIGANFRDRLLRAFAGRIVDMSITCWGGTIFLLEGSFGRVDTRFMILTAPLDDGRSALDGMVFVRRGRTRLARALLDPLSLAVRRLFTHGYLAEEAAALRGPRYRRSSLLECDREMIAFFRWLADLPQGPRPINSTPEGAAHEAR